MKKIKVTPFCKGCGQRKATGTTGLCFICTPRTNTYEVKHLIEDGWEYEHISNEAAGLWIDPVTKASMHITKALKIYDERHPKDVS
jgi:hypothetical protein